MARGQKPGLMQLGPGGRVTWEQVSSVATLIAAGVFVWWAALQLGRWLASG
jgi:hypothetical protein